MRGHGGGGMLSGLRGTNAGGMHAPTADNLTDDEALGKVYDNTVVMRLLTYIAPYKKDALMSLFAVAIYTAANVCIPLLIMLGINWGVNSGNVNNLHLVGLAFFVVTLVHFGANYLQFVYVAKVGQGILYSLRTEMFDHLQELSTSFFHRTSVGRIMSRSLSDVNQIQETFELIVVALADLLSLFLSHIHI